MSRPSRLLAIAVLSGAAACTGAPDEIAYRLADYTAVARFVAPPGQLIPGSARTGESLGQGWRPQEDWAGAWIVGTEATLSFHAPGGDDVVMRMDARAVSWPGAPAQRMKVRLNDESVTRRIVIPEAWTTHEITLPGDLITPGYNHLNLRFEYAANAAGTGPPKSGSGLAMEVRSLAVGTAPALAPAMAMIDASGAEAPAFDLELPTNSMYEVLVELTADARLTGTIVEQPTPEGYAAIELVTSPRDPEAETVTEIWRQSLDDPSPIAVDLAAWAGQTVGLRARARGTGSATVTWRDLQVTAPPHAIPDSARPFAELQAPPLSRRLERPDIYLIILDAARADAFSPYGAERPTPAVSSLADDGTVYANAYSAAPWTGQGMTSLLTGRDPEAHGVDVWGRQLPDGIPLLQEVVGTLGYHTVLWTQHTMYQGNRTLRRGFDRYVKLEIDSPEQPDPETLFLDGYPTFALIHYLPPHGPYDPPPPYRGTYSDWTDGQYPANGQFLHQFPKLRDISEMTPDHLRYVRDRYDDNVLFADTVVQGVIDLLKQHDRYDNALIILASDHGEGFMEHGFFQHTRFLYDEVLRVPFIMKWPAGTRGYESRVDIPVSTIQLPATITDLLGIDAPLARFQGQTLTPAAFGDEVDYAPLFYSSRGRAQRDTSPLPMAAMRVGNLKIHHYENENLTQLFDLATDPGEHNDLSEEMPTVTAYLLQQMRLRQTLSRKLRSIDGTAGETMELDEDARRELRALGYIQ